MSETPENRIWFLRNTPIFEDQSESMYESVGSRSAYLEFDRGDVLPTLEGERSVIYVIESGQVKLRSMTETGKEIILDVLGPGGVFGPLDEVTVDHRPADNSPLAMGTLASEAIAISTGTAFKYNLDYFNDLVQRRPTLMVNVSRILGLRRKQLELRLARLLYRSSLGKVAGLLAELGERYGSKQEDAIHLDLRLTHQEMASIVGLKRETVSEALAELEYRGLIVAGRGNISLLKPGELDRIQ